MVTDRQRVKRRSIASLSLALCSVMVALFSWPFIAGRSGLEAKGTFIPLGCLALAAWSVALLASSRRVTGVDARSEPLFRAALLVTAIAAVLAVILLGATVDDPDGAR